MFRLKEHTRRLFNSAKILGMAMPWAEDQVNAGLRGRGHGPARGGPHGPITAKLQKLYLDVVQGKSDKHAGWLTPI